MTRAATWAAVAAVTVAAVAAVPLWLGYTLRRRYPSG